MRKNRFYRANPEPITVIGINPSAVFSIIVKVGLPSGVLEWNLYTRIFQNKVCTCIAAGVNFINSVFAPAILIRIVGFGIGYCKQKKRGVTGFKIS